MTEAVIDASVVLAFLNGEQGCDAALAIIPDSFLSAVNLSEVVAKLAERGLAPDDVLSMMRALPCLVVDFDRVQAETAGILRASTRRAGLSLGDRACLALALVRGLPAFTADRAWSKLELGVDVRLIR